MSLLHTEMWSNRQPNLVVLGHDDRLSDSPYVERVGRIRAESAYSSLCPADIHWNMLLMKHKGKVSISVWGPMTRAAVMPYREGAEFLYITFKLGTFMPHLPVRNLLDTEAVLPQASRKAFWLNASVWQYPTFENAETFVERLVREELLVQETAVDALLRNQLQVMSLRSAQRRFVQATGLTRRYLHYVQRARRAAVLLQQGSSILDTVYALGYADQAHMSRALRYLIGKTPTQIMRASQPQ